MTRSLHELDLTSVRTRLIVKGGWTPERADQALAAYRRFLQTCKDNPGTEFRHATRDEDDAHHCHLMSTRQYMQDCEAYVGFYIHHTPKDTDCSCGGTDLPPAPPVPLTRQDVLFEADLAAILG